MGHSIVHCIAAKASRFAILKSAAEAAVSPGFFVGLKAHASTEPLHRLRSPTSVHRAVGRHRSVASSTNGYLDSASGNPGTLLAGCAAHLRVAAGLLSELTK